MGIDGSFDPGSFRDPSNRVLRHGDAVYRLLDATALNSWRVFAESDYFRRVSQDGRLVETRELPLGELPFEIETTGWQGALEHRLVPCISYPYEWSFGMLQDAALLQLELLHEALESGFSLKDASPYNIQWLGVRPCFIDVGSFEPWREGDVWVGYRQFCQLFLFPLWLRAYKDFPFQGLLRSNLQGIPPAEIVALMSWRDRLRPGVMLHGWMQARMIRRFAHTRRDVQGELRSTGFRREMIQANVARLRRQVERLSWRADGSPWANYAEDCSYAEQERQEKERFVDTMLGRRRWRSVWDLGCNTGTFSEIAARHADLVVALDGDELAVERLYQKLRERRAGNILPLVMDLSQPSPALGWRGRERAALEQRGKPEAILCLALVHHLAITASIPLAEILDWLRDLGGELIVEFPHREDPMVQTLLRPKLEPHQAYQQQSFESLLEARYEVAESKTLAGGTRTLYHARPKR